MNSLPPSTSSKSFWTGLLKLTSTSFRHYSRTRTVALRSRCLNLNCPLWSCSISALAYFPALLRNHLAGTAELVLILISISVPTVIFNVLVCPKVRQWHYVFPEKLKTEVKCKAQVRHLLDRHHETPTLNNNDLTVSTVCLTYTTTI